MQAAGADPGLDTRHAMAGEARRRDAVLLDAMGTLVHLDDPVPRLRAALAEHAGLDVDLATAAAALEAEIAFYRAHLDTAVDAPSLAALRARCAEAMRPALAADGATDGRLTVALLAGIRFAPTPRLPGRSTRCAPTAARWSSSRTGTSRSTSGSWRRACGSSSTAWSRPSPSAPPSRTARRSRAAWRSRACRPQPPGTPATTSPRTSRARAGQGSGPCSWTVTGTPAPWTACPRSPRSRAARAGGRPLTRLRSPAPTVSCPPRMSVPPPSFQHPGSPPPRPELPEGVRRPEPSPSGDALPRWPLWSPFAGMLMTLLVAVVAVGVIAFVAEVLGLDVDRPGDDVAPGVTIAGTYVQDLALIASALLLARWLDPPVRLRQFGLRPTPFGSALGWLVLAWVIFIAFSYAWTIALDIQETDDLPTELGADGSTAALVAIALLVCVHGPDRGGAVLPRLRLHRVPAHARHARGGDPHRGDLRRDPPRRHGRSSSSCRSPSSARSSAFSTCGRTRCCPASCCTRSTTASLSAWPRTGARGRRSRCSAAAAVCLLITRASRQPITDGPRVTRPPAALVAALALILPATAAAQDPGAHARAAPGARAAGPAQAAADALGRQGADGGQTRSSCGATPSGSAGR